MAYAANILPVEAAYYTLTNATITGGILAISPGGSASYTITETDITELTESFRVSVLPQPATNGYNPRVLIKVKAITSAGVSYDFTMVPSGTAGSIISFELAMEKAAYSSFTFTVSSLDDVSFTLWELCPEASEEIDMTIIEGVQQSLPKLLYDYNMTPLVIQQDEATVGLITFNLLDNTDLQGHFAITCIASEPCILTLRFKDTGITELYSPMLYDLQPGRSSIGIPHAYLHRLAGNHSTYVTAQISTGTLSVGTRAILYTIDGGYLAERIADLGILTEDVSLSQHIGDYEPDYVYAIGIDGGEAMVRRRAYTAKSHIAFDPVYSVGPAKKAAIEFNGHWVLRTDLAETAYTMVTEENPNIFLIDMSDNLVVQVGNDTTTRLTLDTNVSSMSVCRAYDSIIYLEQDQGLICLYIKAGALYYCSYCYGDGRYVWTGPFEVTIPDMVGTIQSAYVHRLNDYRVSFVVTTDQANYWMISDRTYVGQTAKPEVVDVLYRDMYPLMAQLPANDATVPNLTAINTAIDSTGKILTVTFNKNVRLANKVEFIQQITNETSLAYITDIAIQDDVLTITLNEANKGGIVLSWPGTCLLQYNGIRTYWYPSPTMEVTFYGGYCTDTIELGYSTIQANVTCINTAIPTENNYEDTIAVNYSSILSTVTPYPVSTIRTAYLDTAAIEYETITGNVTIIQTGVSPI